MFNHNLFSASFSINIFKNIKVKFTKYFETPELKKTLFLGYFSSLTIIGENMPEDVVLVSSGNTHCYYLHHPYYDLLAVQL